MKLEHTHCCGLSMLAGVTIVDDNSYLVKEIYNKLEQARSECVGMVIVTLDAGENRELGKVLRGIGFSLLKKFWNPNSVGYVWAYWINPSKVKKQKVKKTQKEVKTVKKKVKKGIYFGYYGIA